MDINNLISLYLADHELSWAPSTLKSEKARLSTVAEHLLPQAPNKLWTLLLERNFKPYARVTVWIRICNFIDWCIDKKQIEGPNQYVSFRAKNRRLFKNVYQRKLPNIKYDEALLRINSISNIEIRDISRELLRTGMRASEALKVQDGSVVGKGSKWRKIYGNKNGVSRSIQYHSLYSQLKKETGLTPHMLRKICLSRVVELGANPFELCKIAGWSSLETARSYIESDDNKIKDLMERVQNGTK